MGHNKPKTAAKPAQSFGPIDIAEELGVPVTQRGQPNMREFVPKRFVQYDEARARGWSRYWDGGACRYGHMASRGVANRQECSDCVRERSNEPPIYPRSKAQQFYEKTPPKDSSAAVQPAPASHPEPSGADKQFLTEYAAKRDIEAAAAAVGATVAQITARRSHNPVLDDAMSRLETNLTIPRLVPESPPFDWTKEKEARLFEAYVDSGNLAVARDAIKCTPSQFFRHLEADRDFADEYDRMRPLAAQAFEERGHQLALAGNDKLLPLILRAEKPEKYTERMHLNMNVSRTDKMSDEQLSAEFLRMLTQLYKLSPHEFEKTALEAQHLAQLELSTEVIVDAQYTVQASQQAQATSRSSTAGGTSSSHETNSEVRGNHPGNDDLI